MITRVTHVLRNNKTSTCCILLAVAFLYFGNMSIYRNTVWFFKGWQEYTRNGYQTASKKFNEADLQVDCSGKSYLITGSNSGIGKSVAEELAKRGGTVHMVCRNSSTANEASEEIRSSTGNQNIHVHILDMSRPRDVVDFTRTFPGPLDVLVNNAGCMVNKREVDLDGLEKNFATNVLGTYLLTVGLLPLLEKSAEPRVVTVSSGGMLTQKLDVADLQFQHKQPFDGTVAYAQNKRAQVIFNEHLAKINTKVHFSTMHPGWADTPAVRLAMPDFYERMKNRLRSPEQGADTAVWLSVSQAALKISSGLFFQDRTPVTTHLPLAWTRSTESEEASLMTQLQSLHQTYSN